MANVGGYRANPFAARVVLNQEFPPSGVAFFPGVWQSSTEHTLNLSSAAQFHSKFS